MCVCEGHLCIARFTAPVQLGAWHVQAFSRNAQMPPLRPLTSLSDPAHAQHFPLLFDDPPGANRVEGLLVLLSGTFCGAVCCFCRRLFSTRFCAAVRNAISTFAAVFADVPTKTAPMLSAFALPSSSETTNSLVTSILLPTKIFMVAGPHSVCC